ncbi:unnamed protein product [Urochloa decumbens]|uniref:Uncharacterized protein n=1 Tax=Urochloa decumbens TaxID=240449 RepID=A0ABC9BVL5_9POAL
MAMAARAFHLAVIGLALLHLLAQATTAENLHISSRTTTATTLPSRGFAFPLGSDARPAAAALPTSSHHPRAPSTSADMADAAAPHGLGVSTMAAQDATAAAHAAPVVVSGVNLRDEPVFSDRLHAQPPSTTLSDESSPRSLGVAAAAFQGEDAAAASPRAAAPGGCALSTRAAAAVDSTEAAAPRLGATTKALLHAGLPLLLAVRFLPASVSTLVALSSLATPARARSDDCYKLHHATCTVYPYDNETGSVDRARPDPELGKVCLHPLCHADSADRLLSSLHAQRRGRGDDILYVYCAVRTLEGAPSILPWRNTWSVHLPVADPRAAAASGGDICYVDLAHLGYTEGYYIHCPVAEHRQTYCTEFPDEAIAAAVWEHRRLNYRDTAGPRYATYQAKYGEL